MREMEKLIQKLELHQVSIDLVNGQLKLKGEKGRITPEILQEVRANKAELVQYLRNKLIADIPVLVEAGQSYYNLSPAQQEIWLNTTLYQGTFFNQSRTFKLKGQLDTHAFQQSVVDLLEQHEILRTSFHLIEGVPYQRVNDQQTFHPTPIEFRSFEQEPEPYQQAIDWITQKTKHFMILSRGHSFVFY